MEAEYIKGTKWVYMIEVFRHIDKNIFNLLSECNENNYIVSNMINCNQTTGGNYVVKT